MSPRTRAEEGKSQPARRESLRVVIADDDHDSVLVLSALFREEGHQTKGVYRGDEVLAAIEEFKPDVVLVDLMMPGMTGLDVAREVRQRLGRRAPLLIAVTAWNTATDKVLARAAGFDEHIGKPYAPEELLALVDERSRQRRSQHAGNVTMTPVALTGAQTLHSRLLRKLADILGSIEAVRRALMVPTADMSRWIAGVEPMPRSVFVRATDLLIKSTPAPNATPAPAGRPDAGTTDEDSSG
jgi:two-component system OmpR family response regulator